MDTTKWPQGIIGVVEKKKARPHKEAAALNCPRCSSTNTKFCYYNNYSLTQPRYFCKACRRYWTQGGCLRNVPVGGASRKNRRPSSSSSSSSSPQINHHNNHNNSTIPMSEYMALPFDPRNPTFSTNSSSLPFMDLFKSGTMGIPVYGNGITSSLGFPVEGYNGDNSTSIVFPFGEMKQLSVPNDDQFEMQADEANNNGAFWNGMIAGGSSW